MKKWAYLFSPFFFYVFYGLGISQFELDIFKSGIEAANPPGYYDYRGVTHVHSIRSSGAASYAEIVKAADESDLDFLVLTDLNDFDADVPEQAYYSDVLFIHGGEYSYLDSHLLYYNAPSDFRSLSGLGQAQVHLSDRLSQKNLDPKSGFLVLAHPLQKGSQWSGGFSDGLEGLEIVNLAALWERTKRLAPHSLAWSLLMYPFNPHLAMFRLMEESPDELDLWDQFLAHHPTTGIMGNDTSAKAFTVGSTVVQFPTYKTSFDVASNHVLLRSELTGEPAGDRKKISEALRNGQFYIAMDTFAKAKGFLAEVRIGKKGFPLGSKLKFQKGLEIIVNLPHKPVVPFEVVIFKDGQRYLTSNSQKTTMDVHSTGVYRVMVRVSPTLPLPDGIKWFPWIYTNPFYIEP